MVFAVETEQGPGLSRDSPRLDLGWTAPLALTAAVGVLICSVANAFARAGSEPTEVVFWLGVLLIAAPMFYRLSSSKATAGERLALVALLGLALFGVKVVRDAPIFTFSDEFVHAYNVHQIEVHHHLFHENPIIAVTARYPGLEGATSALTMLTGMSTYAAGTIIVAVARVVFVAALFLLFARVGNSSRAAALGVAAYTGTSNFLYWNVQFSYESLALPLFVFVLLAVAERDAAWPTSRRAWAVVIVLGSAAVVITHHITSYALVVSLVALAVLYRVLKVKRPNPWPFAAAAAAMCAAWLVVAAHQTVGYLWPVIRGAIESTLETASGGAPPRTLFHSSAGKVGGTPLPARAIALLAVGLLAVGLLVGLRRIWRERTWREPFPLLFVIAALGFFGALALRFAPAAWETGNRAGEFLFLGLAFVVAAAAIWFLRSRESTVRRRAMVAAALSVLLVGGAISGWPWDIQLSKPLAITAAGSKIESEPVAFARWARRHLPDDGFAATQADARLLLEPGGLRAMTGSSPDIESVISRPYLEDWHLPLLRENHLRFVVVDDRAVASDTLRGYFFTVPGELETSVLPPGVTDKFRRLPLGSLWDSGHIVAFDTENRP